MAEKYRQLTSNGGPDTKGCFQPFGSMARVDLNDYTNSNQWPVYVAPQVSAYSTVQAAPSDFLSSSGYIQSLSGIWVMFDTIQSAGLASDFFFSLYRAGAQVGTARIAGWTSGNTPAFGAFVAKFVPFNIANTTALTGAPNKALATTVGICRLKPFDVITVSLSAKAQFSGNLFVLPDVQ
jgi:hypothetical protein